MIYLLQSLKCQKVLASTLYKLRFSKFLPTLRSTSLLLQMNSTALFGMLQRKFECNRLKRYLQELTLLPLIVLVSFRSEIYCVGACNALLFYSNWLSQIAVACPFVPYGDCISSWWNWATAVAIWRVHRLLKANLYPAVCLALMTSHLSPATGEVPVAPTRNTITQTSFN